MPLSTSSSESRFCRDRTPPNASFTVWGLSLLLAATLLSAGETAWRWVGHRPTVVDSLALWSFHRGRASIDDPRTLVLCGASRTLLGFSTSVFRERHPDWTVVQLAVDGREPRATLEDLAADLNFRGTVLLEIHESAIGYTQGQTEQVEYHQQRQGWMNSIECLCSATLQQHLAIIQPVLNPKRMLSDWWWQGRYPIPSYRQGHFDRGIDADYQRLDLAYHREWRLHRVRSSYHRWQAPTPAEWNRKAARLIAAAETIRGRGGKVIFVRYPTSGEYWQLDNQYFPRARYWDPLVQENRLLAVHFMDLPRSSHLDCPDASHLDYRDKEVFTNELIDAMDRLLVPASAPSQGSPARSMASVN